MEHKLRVNAGGQGCLQLVGNLDRDSLSKDFFQNLSRKQADELSSSKQLTVSLASVDRADTAGLAWLINMVRDAKAQNIKVIFEHVPDKLLHLADLSGAKEILQG